MSFCILVITKIGRNTTASVENAFIILLPLDGKVLKGNLSDLASYVILIDIIFTNTMGAIIHV